MGDGEDVWLEEEEEDEKNYEMPPSSHELFVGLITSQQLWLAVRDLTRPKIRPVNNPIMSEERLMRPQPSQGSYWQVSYWLMSAWVRELFSSAVYPLLKLPVLPGINPSPCLCRQP